MTSNEVDIEVAQGETLRITGFLEEKNPSTGVFERVDLTGASISGYYFIDNTTTNFTGAITNASEGEYKMIELSAATTAALVRSKSGRYRAFVQFASGDKQLLSEGNFRVL